MSKKLSQLNRNRMTPFSIMKDTTLSMHYKLNMLEQYMKNLPQVECPIKEVFGDGVYVRELFMPAGTFALGRIHKFDHISIMISGELYMWTEDDDLVHLEGYNIVRAREGVKRVGYIIKDVRWITAHRVGEGIAPENILDYLTTVSYEEYLEFKENMINPLVIENS